MVWKSREAKREWEKAHYARTDVCECGIPWKRHRVCAACGVRVGPSHEGTVLEPYGPYKVCLGCFRHLRGDYDGIEARITIPASPGHGEMAIEEIDDDIC